MENKCQKKQIQGPKKSIFQGPIPLSLALVMDAARIKSITHISHTEQENGKTGRDKASIAGLMLSSNGQIKLH
jgi:hypothetical protein